jgi:NitT/TauT family transport system substrate-binding protein
MPFPGQRCPPKTLATFGHLCAPLALVRSARRLLAARSGAAADHPDWRNAPVGRRLAVLLALSLVVGCAGPAPTTAPPKSAPTAAATTAGSASAGAPAAAASPAAAPTAPPTPAALQTVRVGALPTLADAPALIGQRRGYFTELGIDLDLIPLQSGTEAIQALAAGQLEVGTAIILTVALVNAIQRGLNLKIVAPTSVSSAERWATGFAVSPRFDPPPRTLREFTPPIRVAIAGEGTMPHAMALLLARRDGVPFSDLSFAFMGFPEMNAALVNGSVDVAGSTEPFVTIGEQNGTAKRWLSYHEVTPGVPIGTVIYGDTLLTRERDLGERFLAAWLRGARDYDDAITTGRDLAEIESIMSARMPAETWALLLRHNTLLYIPPDGTLDPRPLGEVLDLWKELGLVGDFNVGSLIDPAFAERAVARIGRYQPR